MALQIQRLIFSVVILATLVTAMPILYGSRNSKVADAHMSLLEGFKADKSNFHQQSGHNWNEYVGPSAKVRKFLNIPSVEDSAWVHANTEGPGFMKAKKESTPPSWWRAHLLRQKGPRERTYMWSVIRPGDDLAKDMGLVEKLKISDKTVAVIRWKLNPAARKKDLDLVDLYEDGHFKSSKWSFQPLDEALASLEEGTKPLEQMAKHVH
ncbi:uncharacterized protein UTRI_10387_B [Ustilago trichophora]|uniref:Uncharacterized protein n=1 Tax=Ustilago trichophora TaxID=86804 RepID=A0A5C3EBH6_9BASI|nr:uncharacterized protein UTRI_10387_B [Ustilago trichophora]